MDDNHLAAKEIKRLTQLDFPNTQLVISDEGLIERKETKPAAGKSAFVLPVEEGKENKDLLAQNIIDYSQQFLNTPYRRGHKGPNYFDCSGFTSFVFKNFGYSLSSGCVTQLTQGTKIKKKEALKTGDLIFFKGRNAHSKQVGHVGIVVSNQEGNITFIHACLRGVIVEELNRSSYYKPRYVTGLRVLT